MISQSADASCISRIKRGLRSSRRADLQRSRVLYIRALSSAVEGTRAQWRRLPDLVSAGLTLIAPLLAVPAEVPAVLRLGQPRLELAIPAAEVLPVHRLRAPFLVGLAVPRLRARRLPARLLVLDVRVGQEQVPAIPTTAAAAAAATNHRCTPAGASRRVWPTASKESTRHAASTGRKSAQRARTCWLTRSPTEERIASEPEAG